MTQPGQVRRRRIGYLTSDLAVPFERELLTHAVKAATNLDVELVATCGGWFREKGVETFAYDTLRRAKLDGYVLLTPVSLTLATGIAAASSSDYSAATST